MRLFIILIILFPIFSFAQEGELQNLKFTTLEGSYSFEVKAFQKGNYTFQFDKPVYLLDYRNALGLKYFAESLIDETRGLDSLNSANNFIIYNLKNQIDVKNTIIDLQESHLASISEYNLFLISHNNKLREDFKEIDVLTSKPKNKKFLDKLPTYTTFALAAILTGFIIQK